MVFVTCWTVNQALFLGLLKIAQKFKNKKRKEEQKEEEGNALLFKMNHMIGFFLYDNNLSVPALSIHQFLFSNFYDNPVPTHFFL